MARLRIVDNMMEIAQSLCTTESNIEKLHHIFARHNFDSCSKSLNTSPSAMKCMASPNQHTTCCTDSTLLTGPRDGNVQAGEACSGHVVPEASEPGAARNYLQSLIWIRGWLLSTKSRHQMPCVLLVGPNAPRTGCNRKC